MMENVDIEKLAEVFKKTAHDCSYNVTVTGNGCKRSLKAHHLEEFSYYVNKHNEAVSNIVMLKKMAVRLKNGYIAKMVLTGIKEGEKEANDTEEEWGSVIAEWEAKYR